jgi:hypothetical protein
MKSILLAAGVILASAGGSSDQITVEEKTQMPIRSREALAIDESWTNHPFQQIVPGLSGAPQREHTITARIASYFSPVGVFHLAVVPVPEKGQAFLMDGRRFSVDGRETFYIDQSDDLFTCAVGSGLVHLIPSLARVSSSPGGLSAAVAHLARTVSDDELLKAKSRERTIDLRTPATAELFGPTAGSAHPALPTILSKTVVESVLRLDLESPSGQMRRSFWIDLKDGKLLKSAPYDLVPG